MPYTTENMPNVNKMQPAYEQQMARW